MTKTPTETQQKKSFMKSPKGLMLTLGVGVTTAVLLGSGMAAAPPAHAVDTRCYTEFVLYFNSNIQGARYSFGSSRKTLDGYRFACGGAGQGQLIKNNAASAGNNTNAPIVRVYYNSYCQGPSDAISQGSWFNLHNTYNNEASFRFEGSGYDCSR